jgi:AraC-like DNA-binding protein
MMPDTLVVEVFDAAGIHRLSERLSHGNAHRYRLRDPSAASSGPAALSRHVLRNAGGLLVSVVAERLGMAVGIVEPGIDAFCFCDLRSGAMALTPPGTPEALVGGPGRGLIHGGEGGLTALTQDRTARTNLWVTRTQMEAALIARLEDAPRERLRFAPSVDWATPGAAAVRRLLLHAEAEFARDDGMAAQPVALAAFTDLFVQTVLRELPHNHLERLLRPVGVAAPAHLRRAEMFMRAQADAPIGLLAIAAAAGCSVRSLQNAFRVFRETTPHRALQAIRLERAREDLRRGDNPVAAVARRYGFSNPTRFAASYAQRFGERPQHGR